MSLRQRRRFRRPGLPEAAALSLLAVVGVFAVLWWREAYEPDWRQTTGEVVGCSLVRTHYNAQDFRTKVELKYRYDADGTSYTSAWSGLWPEVMSPNALSPNRLQELKEPGYPLVVFFNPDRPEQSRLHYIRDDRRRFYAVLVAISLLLTVYYYAFGYSALKQRR